MAKLELDKVLLLLADSQLNCMRRGCYTLITPWEMSCSNQQTKEQTFNW